MTRTGSNSMHVSPAGLPAKSDSIVGWVHGAAELLDPAPVLLVLAAPRAGAPGGPGGDPRPGLGARLLYEGGEARERRLTVAGLGAVGVDEDDDLARRRQPAPGETLQTLAKPSPDARGVEVQAALHRGRDLVDVLPARAGRPHELPRDRGLRDGDFAEVDGCHESSGRSATLAGQRMSRPATRTPPPALRGTAGRRPRPRVDFMMPHF